MTKSDLKDAIRQDLLRYCITKPLSLPVFIRIFYIDAIPGLKFSLIFRYCQYHRRKNRLLFYLFFLWMRRLKYKYGIDISYRTTIGKGIYIGHFGGIVIHGDAVIGENCNLSQGMTIGVKVRGNNAGVPTIGDRVFIGPGAVIIGGIHVGNDVLIGSNSIVTFDVPDNSVVASPLSTVISGKGSKDYIGNFE